MGHQVTSLLLLSPLLLGITTGNAIDRALPTLYEHYTAGGIKSGLVANGTSFLLNGKDIRLITGTIHYFRVHPDYWRDRLRKLRAGGFVGVETYVPWNLHEPEINVFDFGDGNNDFSPFLNVTKFLKMAQEEDLLVLLRSGPFINAEWENGGLPSWLNRDPNVKTRSSDSHYIAYMTTYFNALFPVLKKLQFTEGGPILAFQIENEFGTIARKQKVKDTKYLEIIRDQMESHGLTSLKYTSDSVLNSGVAGTVSGAMMTANLGSEVEASLAKLKQLQPDKPQWVMEFWTGWFDHWFEKHHSKPAANYNAPLSEAGDYTEKYHEAVKVIAKYLSVQTKLPEIPSESVKMAYPATKITQRLSLSELVHQVDTADHNISSKVIAMELLDINKNSGQSYGFILYRKTNLNIPTNSVLKITGKVNDVAVVMVDGVRKTEVFKTAEQQNSFGYFDAASNAHLDLDSASAGKEKTLDILVENWGRRYGFKGIVNGSVLLNNATVQDWHIYALQFKGNWVRSLKNWHVLGQMTEPTLFRAELEVTEPHDTFLNMSGWGKGNVFVNGFNIGRYFPAAGPPKTLYVPAPLLKKGTNEILVFELYTAASEIVFSKTPILG